jgi:endonuclease/exonuclease/phosphatase family metal-dependent hydrolase
MLTPFADGTPPLFDAWELAHPGVAHPTSFCLYMKMEPGGPELHCDYVFVSDDLRPRVRSIRVDQETQASDHQPVVVEFA